MRKTRLLKLSVTRTCAVAPLALLAACGGGGGGGGGVISAPTPAPAPTPTPTPTPTPAPTVGATFAPAAVPAQFNTAEFRRSDGPLAHNAATAWAAGTTGAGVTIAVIDSGIDEDSPEFTGRISSASRDMTGGNRPLTGVDDHGTNVAMVAAAARNSTGILGIAYDATILALRSDDPGSCGVASSPIAKPDTDCKFPDSILAQAVTYAAQKGARVINMSLGGDDGASNSMKSAVASAVASGALVVISAGNDGTAQVSAFAAELDQVGAGGLLIVGSVDENGAISSFSDRAGDHSSHYLTARGEGICCVYDNGQIYTDQNYVYVMSGTSFSAPQVAGAAALLAQAFPKLTGKQIAQILLQSAFDVGAAGTDAIYGHGILDIAKAMQPSGVTTLAGGTTAVALSDLSGTGSGPMGDALAAASLPAVVLDEFQRAYRADLAGTLRGVQPAARLAAAVGSQTRDVTFGSDATSLAFSIDRSGKAGEMRPISQLRLSRDDADQARVLAARVSLTVNPRLKLGFGYRESSRGLTAQLQGQAQPAFLVAPPAGGDAAGSEQSDTAIAARQQLGSWGLTASFQQGRIAAQRRLADFAGYDSREPAGAVASYGVALDRRFGPVATSIGASRQAEDRTLLGGQFQALGVGGANTLFLDAQAAWQMAPGWRFGAALRQGFTRAERAGLVSGGSELATRSWALDLTRQGVFARSDTVGLRVSQPLRVESGGINLIMPLAWSYDTLAATYGVNRLALAPSGRELVGELAWQGRLLGGNGSASLFYRRDPGHYEQVPDDTGAAMRWARKF